MHSQNKAIEARGKLAIDTLLKRVGKRWAMLPPGQRKQLGSDPNYVVDSIRERAAQLGAGKIKVEPPTLAQRRERLKKYSEAFGTMPAHFPHLEDPELEERGPAGPRKKSQAPARRLVAIDLRALDDKTVAFGGLEGRDLERMKKSANKLRTVLARLRASPAGRRVLVQESGKRRQMLDRTISSLHWVEHELFPELIQFGGRTGPARSPDLHRRVIGLLNYIQKTTGKCCYEQLADILNWLAPFGSGDWTARLLKDWKRKSLRD